MSEEYGIHWFRRDLRVAGNRALYKNWLKNQGRVVGLFCFDKAFLSREDFSVNRFQFFLETLASLQEELREIGSDLLLLDVGPQAIFPPLLEELKKQNGKKPSLISWNRDYEPFARKRDQEITELLKSDSIKTLQERDHLLIEPWELVKNGTENEYYKVYTPFSKKWRSLIQEDYFTKRVSRQKSAFQYLLKKQAGEVSPFFKLKWSDLLNGNQNFSSCLESYLTDNGRLVDVPLPPTGSSAVLDALNAFQPKLSEYKNKRDVPSLENTSRFSLYLKNGSLTVAQIIHFLQLSPQDSRETGEGTFYSELIWREFFYHILFHEPRVEKESFQSVYKDIPWQNNESYFKAWKEGMTGFPLVDAAMRELNTTGWMHNRARMIVASFLTKDLLINWQWGEQYFMDKLLDGDLAANNGGWQWAASTGCDAQPYFRIFNPWTQSQKFDPNGDYIKKFLPELKDLTPQQLHQPVMGHCTYPEPIVDHKEQREKALDMFKETKEKFTVE